MFQFESNLSTNCSIVMDTGQPEQSLASTMHFISILIIPIGLIGNMIIILVLKQRSYKHDPTFFYMKSLAWSDTLIVLVMFCNWLDDFLHFSRHRDWNLLREIFLMLQCILGGLSCFILLLMLLDRYQHARYNQRDREYSTTIQAKIFFIIFIVFSIIYHLPQIWIQNYQEEGGLIANLSLLHRPITALKIYWAIHLLLFDRILLFIAIIGLVILLSHDLLRHQNRYKTIDFIVSTDNGRARDITRMVVVSSWILLVLILPHMVYKSATYLSPQVMQEILPTDLKCYTFLLLHLSSAINFLIYLSTSNSFYSDFCRLVLRLFYNEEKDKEMLLDDYMEKLLPTYEAI